MTVNIKPETERLLRKKPWSREAGRKTPAKAVAHIRELRKGNRLPSGVTIKDIINEGRA